MAEADVDQRRDPNPEDEEERKGEGEGGGEARKPRKAGEAVPAPRGGADEAASEAVAARDVKQTGYQSQGGRHHHIH